MSLILLAQAAPAVTDIGRIIIYIIVIAGIIGIAAVGAQAAGVTIPPFFWKIFWIVVAVIVAVFAIRFLLAWV